MHYKPVIYKLCWLQIAPPSTPDFSAEQVQNFPKAWSLLVAVVRLHVRDLHAVGWGVGP